MPSICPLSMLVVWLSKSLLISVGKEIILVLTSSWSSMDSSAWWMSLSDTQDVRPTLPCNGSAREQLAAAAKGEAEKKVEYTDMVETQQASFLPFAVETYGGLGKSARKLIKQIASAAEDLMQMLTEEEIREELRGSVAIAIQKGNAMIMLSAYHKAIGVSARTRRGFAAVAA